MEGEVRDSVVRGDGENAATWDEEQSAPAMASDLREEETVCGIMARLCCQQLLDGRCSCSSLWLGFWNVNVNVNDAKAKDGGSR